MKSVFRFNLALLLALILVSCGASANGQIIVTSPSPNSQITSPVSLRASYAGAKQMQVILDGVSIYQAKVSSVNLSVSLATGSHTVQFRAQQQRGGWLAQSVAFTVAIPPPTASLTGTSPIWFPAGTSLTWSTSNATSVSISGVGTVGASGSLVVYPAQNTTYTLTATGSGGTVTATATVRVYQPLTVVTQGFPDGTCTANGVGGWTPSPDPYYATIQAAGGSGNYIVTIDPSYLPPGLSASGNVVSGHIDCLAIFGPSQQTTGLARLWTTPEQRTVRIASR